MIEQEPTELMILLRIVEVIERKMLRNDRGAADGTAVRHIANVVNNFIASSPNLLFDQSEKRIVMGDSYTTGQAGAVGPFSAAQGITFNQIWKQEASSIDLAGLARELEQVRTEMRRTAGGEPEQDLALAEMAQAELSAKSDDGPTALGHLRKAGNWALEVAKSIGAEVTVAAIKAALSL